MVFFLRRRRPRHSSPVRRSPGRRLASGNGQRLSISITGEKSIRRLKDVAFVMDLEVERRLEGKTYNEIAKELDLTDYNMENCAAIRRLMEAAGLPEPYRRLTEKPGRVPQWCSKPWLKAGERKGGGKRRRAS